MSTYSTPYMGFVRPVPGSNQPYITSQENAAWESVDAKFQAVDAAAAAQTSADDARLDAIERFTLPSLDDAVFMSGVIPAGTEAERNAYWGLPADAPARLKLANRGARWFNTDKGYEQQYFAQFDDAGVTATTPARKLHGWAPAAHLGWVPLAPASIANTTGTATKKGRRIEFAGVTVLSLNGIFDKAAFGRYRIDIEYTGSVAATAGLRLRAAGVDAAGAGSYGWQNIGIQGTGTAAAASTGDTSWPLPPASADSVAFSKVELDVRPNFTRLEAEGYWGTGTPAMNLVKGFRGSDAVAYDGFTLMLRTGASISGSLSVFGQNIE